MASVLRPSAVPHGCSYLDISYEASPDATSYVWRVRDGLYPVRPSSNGVSFVCVANNSVFKMVPVPDLGPLWTKAQWTRITMDSGTLMYDVPAEAAYLSVPPERAWLYVVNQFRAPFPPQASRIIVETPHGETASPLRTVHSLSES